MSEKRQISCANMRMSRWPKKLTKTKKIFSENSQNYRRSGNANVNTQVLYSVIWNIGEKNIEIFAASATKCTVHIDGESRTEGPCLCRRAIIPIAARCLNGRHGFEHAGWIAWVGRCSALGVRARARAHTWALHSSSGRDMTGFTRIQRTTITNHSHKRRTATTKYGMYYTDKETLTKRCLLDRIEYERIQSGAADIQHHALSMWDRLAWRMPLERDVDGIYEMVRSVRITCGERWRGNSSVLGAVCIACRTAWNTALLVLIQRIVYLYVCAAMWIQCQCNAGCCLFVFAFELE